MGRAIKILAAAMLIMSLISVPVYAGAAELKGWIDDLSDDAQDLSDNVKKANEMLIDDQELADAGLSRLSSSDIADMRKEISTTSDSIQNWENDLKKIENDYSSFKSDFDQASSGLSAEDRSYLRVDMEGLEDNLDGIRRDLDRVRDRVADLKSRLGGEAR